MEKLRREIEALKWYLDKNKLTYELAKPTFNLYKKDELIFCRNHQTLTDFISLCELAATFFKIDDSLKQLLPNTNFLINAARKQRANLILGNIQKGKSKDDSLYTKSLEECSFQGFLPIATNALWFEDSNSYVEPLYVWFTKDGDTEIIKFHCDVDERMKIASKNARNAVLHLLRRMTLTRLTIDIAIKDFPGGYDQDKPFSGESIGLAMAIAIYFNFQLYCVREDKNKLEYMRGVFEKEIENVAFTGEINDSGEILSISGIEQKVKAADYMEMKRVFCPSNNRTEAEKVRNEIKSVYEKNKVLDKNGNIKEPLSVIPINSLEQAIALIRYGQYLKDAAKATLPCFVESSFSVLTDSHLKEHFLSNVTFSHVVKRQAEMFGGDIAQGVDRFAERDTFIPNQPKAKVLDEFLKRGILISGDGGIGKTTFLQHLLQDYSEKIINGIEIKEFKGQLKIPVYIELAKYRISKELKDFKALIKESFSEHLKYLSEKDIEELINDELKNGRFILLLDGVNEIAAKQDSFHKEMLGVSPDNLFIVTSRGNTQINLAGFQRLEIEKLDKEKIEKYIENRLRNQPEKANVLKKVFTERHSDIGRNPFFLSLIVEDAEVKDASEINEGRYRNRGKLLDSAGAGPTRTPVPESFEHLIRSYPNTDSGVDSNTFRVFTGT